MDHKHNPRIEDPAYLFGPDGSTIFTLYRSKTEPFVQLFDKRGVLAYLWALFTIFFLTYERHSASGIGQQVEND